MNYMQEHRRRHEDIAELAILLSGQIDNIGLTVARGELGLKTEKFAAAVDWLLEDDTPEKRKAKGVELLQQLKDNIVSNCGPDAKVVERTLNIFNDIAIHRSGKVGIYGWVEVVK